MFSVASLPGKNLGEVYENSQAGENLDCVSGFHWSALKNSPKRSPKFSPGYEGTENMSYFLAKIQESIN